MPEKIGIRDACETDLEAVLCLNKTFEHFLSPLDLGELVALVDAAAYSRVAEIDGKIAAFLVAFVSKAKYDSVNYRWFDGRFDDFAYIDRIAVVASAQGQSLGPRLYDDLANFARSKGLAQLTCEYYIEPMNEGSARFHKRYGFKEIGQQALEGGKKRVSLQSCALVP